MKNETTTTVTAKVKGFITETHEAEIENTFGSEVADLVKNAAEGETFLSILMKAGKI